MAGAHGDVDQGLADACRALASATRLEMLRILSERERYCGDLVKLFDLSQSTVSHHLKALREAELVIAEKRGVSICYRVNKARIEEIQTRLSELL